MPDAFRTLGRIPAAERFENLYMANSKIMRRLESDTTLDNVYATGKTRNRLVTPVR